MRRSHHRGWTSAGSEFGSEPAPARAGFCGGNAVPKAEEPTRDCGNGRRARCTRNLNVLNVPGEVGVLMVGVGSIGPRPGTRVPSRSAGGQRT